MRRRPTTLPAAVGVAVLVALTTGAPDGMVWTQGLDAGPDADTVRMVAVAGRRLAVAGRAGPASNFDHLAAALDRRRGRELWSDTVDFAGGYDLAWYVAAKGPRMFTVGRGWDGVDTDLWFVEARRARNGTVLWEDTVDLGGSYGIGLWCGAAGRRVVTTGYAKDGTALDRLVVQTRDARSGAVLWEDVADYGTRVAIPQTAAIARGRVIVVGYAGAPVGYDVVVRCYRLRDGELLWDRRIDPHGLTDFGNGVYVHRDTVVVSAGVTNPDFDYDLAVFGLDLRTGADLWDDVYDGGHEDRGWRVAGRGAIAWVSGWSDDGGGKRSTVVRAYGVRDGTVLWTHVADDPTDEVSTGYVARVGRHVAFTADLEEPGGDYDVLLRVLDGRTGAVRWDERVDVVDGTEWAGILAAKGKTFFVPLNSQATGESAEVRIEAYRVR